MNIKNLNNSLKLINDYEKEVNDNRFYIELNTNAKSAFIIDSAFIINSTFVIANNTFIETSLRRDREKSRKTNHL